MFTPEFTITNTIANALTKVERARGFLEAATLSEEWIREMSERALLLEAHHTTHIEGTRLSLEQAERLWAGENVSEADKDDARELLNYRRAFDLVAEYLNSGEPVVESLIREIHKKLVEGVRGGRAAPGEYRKIQNYVFDTVAQKIVYTPPSPQDVPPMMREFVQWLEAEKEIHSVLVSGIAQFQLVHIHPFVDGNGRTARLLSTLCLYRAGYDFKRLFTISEFYDQERSKYYRAIQSVRESNMDMTGWLEYFVNGLASQMQEQADRGKRVIKRDVLSRQYELNVRQELAIGFLLKHGRIRIQDYETLCPGFNRRTLQRDLKEMAKRRIVVLRGATHQLTYELAEQ